MKLSEQSKEKAGAGGNNDSLCLSLRPLLVVIGCARPSQGTGSVAVPSHQTALHRSAVVLALQLSVRTQSVSMGVLLQTSFQLRTQISNHCTTQDCAAKTWCFFSVSKSEPNQCEKLCTA